MAVSVGRETGPVPRVKPNETASSTELEEVVHMAVNEYLSYSEWYKAVNRLCLERLKRCVDEVKDVSPMLHDAWEDGVTPEEFFEVDVTELLNPENINHGI